jgi:hypothetical protein
VLRGLEELVSRRLLDDAPEVHHADFIAEVTHDGEVMGDEEVGQVEALLELSQEVYDLSLDGDVECAHRLIEEQELGL